VSENGVAPLCTQTRQDNAASPDVWGKLEIGSQRQKNMQKKLQELKDIVWGINWIHKGKDLKKIVMIIIIIKKKTMEKTM